MYEALSLARQAESAGEVPVGAVLVSEGRVVARAYNRPVALNDPTAHAEILVMREAGIRIANYRLLNATLYVTLEPCPMCAGAMVNARLGKLVFACRDLRFGGVRSKFRIADSDLLNHQVDVVEGILAAEAAEMLKAFFERRR